MNVDATNAAAVAKGVRNGRADECGPTTVRRSASIANLAKAMAAAQGELRNPLKDKENSHFKNMYADLATVRDTIMPVLSKHKLAVMQFPCELDDQPALTTILTHDSGEWIETAMKLRPSKSDPQGVGSALTYARRYALQSVCGVAAEEDDDANEASRPQPRQQAEPKDNPQERARAAGALAQAKDEREAKRILADIAKAIDDGDLGPGDAEALRRLGKETLARFKTPAA